MLGKKYKVLVVDSDPAFLASIDEIFGSVLFDVTHTTTAKEALTIANTFIPDFILLDIVLPDSDGIELCSELRANNKLKNSLIVFYTNRNEDYSQIAAFKAGADDYIIKPTRSKILTSRIRALLKRLPGRIQLTVEPNQSNLVIDRERYLVIKNGEEIIFPRKEFELLALLYSSPRKVFTRQEISSYIWGYELVAKNRTIDVHIRKLREKLGDSHIKTVKGIGYSLEL